MSQTLQFGSAQRSHGIADLVIIDSDSTTVKRRINLNGLFSDLWQWIVNNQERDKRLLCGKEGSLADGMKEKVKKNSTVSTIAVPHRCRTEAHVYLQE
ncbi:hypothetical protein ACOJCM_14630 [Billgrantia sp. LNSP4103-1]|uniref:hypothetical protein n=1 Tax=Billgrantia sp. LNSP4103-1 TaxID=3410266 RepID=UPI00403F8E22